MFGFFGDMLGRGNKQIQFLLNMDVLKKSVFYYVVKVMLVVYNINLGGEVRGILSSVWGVSKVENKKKIFILILLIKYKFLYLS